MYVWTKCLELLSEICLKCWKLKHSKWNVDNFFFCKFIHVQVHLNFLVYTALFIHEEVSYWCEKYMYLEHYMQLLLFNNNILIIVFWNSIITCSRCYMYMSDSINEHVRIMQYCCNWHLIVLYFVAYKMYMYSVMFYIDYLSVNLTILFYVWQKVFMITICRLCHPACQKWVPQNRSCDTWLSQKMNQSLLNCSTVLLF